MNIKFILIALTLTPGLSGSNTPYQPDDGLESQWRIESLSIALIKTVWQGNYQWIHFLIARGADPLYEDDDGNSALTILMQQQVDLPAHQKCIETLLELSTSKKDNCVEAEKCQLFKNVLRRKISNYSPKVPRNL